MLQYAWWLLQLYGYIPWASSWTLSVTLESLGVDDSNLVRNRVAGYSTFWTKEVDFVGVILKPSWNLHIKKQIFFYASMTFLVFYSF